MVDAFIIPVATFVQYLSFVFGGIFVTTEGADARRLLANFSLNIFAFAATSTELEDPWPCFNVSVIMLHTYGYYISDDITKLEQIR